MVEDHSDSGQRSLNTFTSAAGTSISNSITSVKSFFSKSDKPAPAAPAAQDQQVPSKAPGFVADAGGNVVPIPAGSTARPADNGNGTVYQPPLEEGQHKNANQVRVMGPDVYQPTGSITVHGPTGQPVDPATGKPGGPEKTHTPIVPAMPSPQIY